MTGEILTLLAISDDKEHGNFESFGANYIRGEIKRTRTEFYRRLRELSGAKFMLQFISHKSCSVDSHVKCTLS